MTKTSLPARDQVHLDETWNLESIFPTISAWEVAYHDIETDLPALENFRGQLSEGPNTLIACFQAVEKIMRLTNKVYVYTGLAASVDMSNQSASARAGQGSGLLAKVRAATSFIEPELMAIGFACLYGWVKNEPTLTIYQHYFKNLEREQAHVRSAEVEEVLALISDPLPHTTLAPYTSLVNADLKFKPAIASDGVEIEVGQSSITALLTHPDRVVRRTAFENYADSYLNFKNTITGIQTIAIKRDIFNMRTRGYSSSLGASMSPNNIPEAVFHNLIDVFKKNLATWHKYWRIRRKALGHKKLHVYDIKAPLGKSPVHVSYKQAVAWIVEGMMPLGQAYSSTLKKGCTVNRWVDHSCNKGKRQGAFSSGCYDTQPFIMMSYADDVFSLSTLAHELGHSMHSYYSRKEQPYIYSNYSLFVAEVASNFNQAMVRNYLFETQKDAQFQLALIEESMSNFHRYFFIMPILAQWELEMHQRAEKGAPINAQSMIDLAAKLFKEGYGDEVVYDHDRIGIKWAQFGHMYMNFYVYQYATGISGAHALVDNVMRGQPGAVDNYLNFLRAGSSIYPLEALKMAGVDLTNPEPVETAYCELANIVDRLDTLVERGL